jgi:4-amino-4-deoxy-L-arabinose transferase-like glycosyltransferase
MHLGNKKYLLFLLIILAIAAFFRLWQLNSAPPGLYPDVAMNGNNALETLRNLDFKVFYPDNNGREGMMMWLIALSFSVFGVSIWSIKIVAAVIGILTVLGLYLLTKELFSRYAGNASRYVSLLASFFLAISFWHVNFSRIGFRAILLPFVLVFSFYFLFKGFRNNKLLNFILAGLFFGLGFYTYTSFRLAVLILPFVLIPYWFLYKDHGFQKKYLFSVFFFLFAIFIIALPLGIYFLRYPQDFISRATSISIFAAENPLREFGKSLISHLGMFNVYGDPNWRHNLAGQPELLWPIGILFLAGIIFSVKDLISSIKRRYHSLSVIHCFLLSTFFIMLLPGILTYEGIPHSLRVIGVIPSVFIFSGLGAWKIYEFLERNARNKKLLFCASFLFLAAMAVCEYSRYFNVWAKNENVKNAFTQDYADIGNFLNSLPSDVNKYVIVNEPSHPLYGISIPAQTPIFIESAEFGQPQSTYLKFEELNKIEPGQNETIIVPLYDGPALQEILQKFPGGVIKTEKDFKFYDLSY